eukprot:NODE_167_length_16327_cov_0.361597.p2 type:complete len:1006 gc:universal NODE_167_length_16327_cov_0.361597:258-3275(+)
MMFKISDLYVLLALAFPISIDCPDVFNLATGLKMGESNPTLLKALGEDCCTAYGVQCYNDRVDSIKWYYQHFTGHINSTALPEMLNHLDLTCNRITGNFIEKFPSYLEVAHLGNNFITGELSNIAMSQLNSFDVGSNNLNGSIPLLPNTLQDFRAPYNMLSGCIPMLFSPLKNFVASNNILTCSIPRSLPLSLRYFEMNSNKITGPIPSLPIYLSGIYLGWNQISGKMPPLPSTLYLLDLQSLDVNGTIHLNSPIYVSIAGSSISYVAFTSTSMLSICDLRDTDLINDVNDPQLSLCERSISVPSTVSDCSEVTKLAYGLNMHISNPDLMREIEFNCCLSKKYITCDTKNVIKIEFEDLNLNGTINGTAIPSLTQSLKLGYNFISGSVPENLPNSLTYLDLGCNFLSGTIPSLPENLQTLNFVNNWLNGSIPESLPWKLNTIYASYNYLTGILPTFFPSTLASLQLSHNYMHGNVPDTLPPALTYLDLQNNRLDGTLPTSFPPKLSYINLRDNQLHGSLPFTLPSTLLTFDVSNNFLNGNLSIIPDTIANLRLNNNKFRGQLLMKRPYQVLIMNNHISNVIITDSSSIYQCDVSRNPLLAHKDDPGLTKCIKNNLYIADCVDVIGFATKLNIDLVQPIVMESIEEDCCSSAGVTCTAGRVKKIEWPNMYLNGTIEASFIPSDLNVLDLSQNRITGFVPEGMPSSLVNLTLHSNKLIGRVPSNLPLDLKNLDLSENLMDGSVPVTLPAGLLSLLLRKNKLSGSLPNIIPLGLVSIDVSNNYLSGSVPNLTTIDYVYLNRDFPPFNQFTGIISVMKPKTLYVPNSHITSILISDTQQMTICNISNNPLLANANDASLFSCVKDVLYSQSTGNFTSKRLFTDLSTISIIDQSLKSILESRFLRTRSRQQSATRTAQYSLLESKVIYGNTLQSAYTNYNTGNYNIGIHWTLTTIGRCALSAILATIILYSTPFTRSIKSWKQRKDKNSKKSRKSQEKPYGSNFSGINLF